MPDDLAVFQQYSPIVVVVVKWSRSRRCYGRQGLLATAEAIDRAEKECLGDAELSVNDEWRRP